MTVNRIVSFLPSATELLYEFGVEDKIYGVTHECRFPEEAISKPQVISSVIDSDKLSSNEINTQTCQLLNEGKDIFILNEKNLKDANPDLIISQETCEVCAAYTNQVNKALQIIDRKPIIHSMDPHNISEILDTVIKLGKILEEEDKAKEISESLEKRIQKIKNTEHTNIPKILAIEWIEPFFTAGHWVPEMIEIAGGRNTISKTGEHSRRMDFEEISNSDADIIILMPCGFDTKRIISEYNDILEKNERWNRLKAVQNKAVFAVDANSFFSKPSIRTIEGIEILAKIIHPEKFKDVNVSKNSFARVYK
ncbi:periplasmic binding protein [Marine Group I thaumarchaeote SCGC AAA799-B03]|uniref:Periplasmic binding protein n=4 Tax=Marine Group I TaxID=905826 RepID=A0A087S853_9ARCH|nr:periplasmic binding protein [Marine Group I thaumarchaeote SCGC AAA799-N04]KFM16007.1 periplasmic binding protein [Marine Group I thaumarchaeote SCGC AAA799-D11]KFM17744.1 periplasmic binding protein [Marine Group I thaumarchaeote SCGC RSA3]KFM21907.1 periplasmic binding protein [Marine Group I thaumarchaeote SCGC AAA799-B03]